MRFVFRAVSGVTSAVFRHSGRCKAGMRTTRRFGGAVSETSGMNATPTAGRSLKDRLMQRRMSSTLVMHELKVTERLVRVASSDCCVSAQDCEVRCPTTDTAVGGSTLEGNEAQESIGFKFSGNAGQGQRT
jgi:hypothetical protein